MEAIPSNELLEYRPDTLEAVRKDVHLDKQTIDESVDLLQDWLQKQAHFTKKDYSRKYLELTLVSCKGSVERTKQRLDRLCTFRTLMPEFYDVNDVKQEFEPLKRFMDGAILPKLTYEHYRVIFLNLITDKFDSNDIFYLFKYVALNGEYLKMHEYASGFVVVLDFREVNPLNVVTAISPVWLRKLSTLVLEGYGMRLKGIHVITPSKLVDAVVKLFKQVLSEKIGSRIIVHNTFESVFEFVPREIIPIEYGGEEKPLKQLFDQWLEILAYEENMENYRVMKNAVTVEAHRQADQFNQQYLGTPGSFRALSVD